MMPARKETDLYEPVKRFWEALGFAVKGEVNGCDLVAVREGNAQPVIVELKKRFTVELLLQGIDRLRLSEHVYVAVEDAGKNHKHANQKWAACAKLCRMLGLGLITVRFYANNRPSVCLRCEPKPYQPRKNKAEFTSLLAEFSGRSGDYIPGGSTRRKLVTVYREEALRIADMLQKKGPASPKQLKGETGIERAAEILRQNYYGWFFRVQKGLYVLSEEGKKALGNYADVLSRLNQADAAD
ncbi:MAG TPA: DUF2161 family putative PD-(D/E)XK-type phosphodiesterase [Bacilli bacterium]